jgi:flagellar hook-basal body complex protein FliE
MQQALEHLRAMREAARPPDAGLETLQGTASTMVEPKTDRPSFLETMRSAVDSVNAQQSLSRQLQNAYVRGDGSGSEQDPRIVQRNHEHDGVIQWQRSKQMS